MSGEPLDSAPGTVKQGNLIEPRARKKPASPYGPASGQSLSPQLVIYAISRWWLTALLAGIVLGVVGAAVTSYVMPRTYRASAWLQIESHRQILAYDIPDSKSYVRTQLALIKSPLVLNDVLSKPIIAQLPEVQQSPSPRKMLERGLSVQAVDNSDLYQLNFDSPYEEHAARIADEIVASYFDQKEEHVDARTKEIIKTLDVELKKKEAEITQKRKDLIEAAKGVAGQDSQLIVNPEDENLFSKMHGPLVELHDRLNRVEVEKQLLNARLQAMSGESTTADRELNSFELATLVETDATLHRLYDKVSEFETRIASAERVNGWGKDHPRLKQMVAEQKAAQEAVEARRQSVTFRVKEELKGRTLASADDLRQQIAAQEALEASLKQKISEERQRLGDTDDQSMQLAFQRLELQRSEEGYNLMAGRVSAMRTEQNAPGRVVLLKNAAENDVVVYSEPIPKIAAVLFMGLLSPFALAVFAEFRLQRITHGEQLAMQADMPVIAEISRVPLQTLRHNSRSPKFETRQALFEESIDQLRTSLMVPDELQSVRVLATVSAVSGEGKSSIASQLAISLARACHEPVLLIDGDTRSPSLQDIFEIKLSPGVVDILQGRCILSEATQQLSDLLYVVPAGELDMNPHALITPGGFRKLLDAARPHYRYIIVDCPPVLAASEAFVLAKSADAAVLCAMRDVSRGHQVKKACSRLHAVGVRTLGVILSGVPTFDYRYRYGSYYYGQHRRDNDSAPSSRTARDKSHALVNGNGHNHDNGFHPGRRPSAK